MFDDLCTATSDIKCKLHQITMRKVMCLSLSLLFVPLSSQNPAIRGVVPCIKGDFADHGAAPLQMLAQRHSVWDLSTAEKTKKSHWFSWATSVKSLLLHISLWCFLLEKKWEEYGHAKATKRSKNCKNKEKRPTWSKAAKNVKLRCMSVSLALCWW